jgi:hypothetical protein
MEGNGMHGSRPLTGQAALGIDEKRIQPSRIGKTETIIPQQPKKIYIYSNTFLLQINKKKTLDREQSKHDRLVSFSFAFESRGRKMLTRFFSSTRTLRTSALKPVGEYIERNLPHVDLFLFVFRQRNKR